MEKIKLCIAGVGGVGGLLAAFAAEDETIELSLIAHGKRAEHLRTEGITLHSDIFGTHGGIPAHVEEFGSDLPIQKYVLVCVKNYSLREIAEQIRGCVGKDTVLVPVMNGIEAADVLRELFPGHIVLAAVIYTISEALPDYSVTQVGKHSYMIVGARDTAQAGYAQALQQILSHAGYDCRYTEDAVGEMWQKFMQNCAYNTVTARYLINSGVIQNSPELGNDIRGLLEETYRTALACGVKLPEDAVEQKYRHTMFRQDPSATSSMRRDAEAGRRTELDTFLGALIRRAEAHGVEVPTARRYYAEMIQRMKV